MDNNAIHPSTGQDETVMVEVEITDPTDGTVRTFSGPDDASVERQIDEFWGISAADEAAGQ